MVELPVPRAICLVESPYAGPTPKDIGQNVKFARNVCRGLCYEGYAPYASHLFYTQFLDDLDPKERNMGISYGLAWGDNATIVFFCLPPGKEITDSKGMMLALDKHRMTGKVTILRRYDEEGTNVLEERDL